MLVAFYHACKEIYLYRAATAIKRAQEPRKQMTMHLEGGINPGEEFYLFKKLGLI